MVQEPSDHYQLLKLKQRIIYALGVRFITQTWRDGSYTYIDLHIT